MMIKQRIMINQIVANSENRVIGKDNKLIWKQREDMLMFMRTTTGHTIVMGRKTWDSMGGKPLKNRRNIVVTRQDVKLEGAEVYNSLDIIDSLNDNSGDGEIPEEIFIIGGGEIYNQTIDKVDRIYQTIIHTEIEGDAYYPEIPEEFEQTSSERHTADEKNEYDYTFLIWDRNG